jgi:hypothetical protein
VAILCDLEQGRGCWLNWTVGDPAGRIFLLELSELFLGVWSPAVRRGDNMVRLGDGTYGMLPQEWMRKIGVVAGTLGWAEVAIDPRPGGSLRIVMAFPDRARVVEGEYLALERPSRLTFSWRPQWREPAATERAAGAQVRSVAFRDASKRQTRR